MGTYRLQTGEVARRNLGYYGDQLFDFSAYDSIRREVLELGRACVHIDYRNIMVLHALWKGIAVYATRQDSRYLLGCSSISSQDENVGVAMYDALKEKYLVHPSLRTTPSPAMSVNPMEPLWNRAGLRASSAPIWRSLAAFAGHQPSIASSRPLISSRWSISPIFPIAYEPAFFSGSLQAQMFVSALSIASLLPFPHSFASNGPQLDYRPRG